MNNLRQTLRDLEELSAQAFEQLSKLYPSMVTDIEERDYRTVKATINQIHQRAIDALSQSRPPTVVLCGSCRFYQAFQEANYKETRAGKFVLSIGFYPHSNEHGGNLHITPEEKAFADNLHKMKIESADEVLILNVGGYIGESTRAEIEYARQLGKPIRFLESEAR